MSPNSPVKLCRQVIHILLTTESAQIFSIVREVLQKLISKVIPFKTDINLNSEFSVDYELSCWLDGVTIQTLDEFIVCLQESSQNSFGTIIMNARAWQQSGFKGSIPVLPVSPCLVSALQNLHRASKAFALLTCQVACKGLLYLTNPLPLAALINESYQQMLTGDASEAGAYLQPLAEYSATLLHFGESTGTQKHKLLFSALGRLFSRGSFPNLGGPSGFHTCEVRNSNVAFSLKQQSDELALIRNLNHLITISGTTSDSTTYRNLVRRLAPVSLAVRTHNLFSFRDILLY